MLSLYILSLEESLMVVEIVIKHLKERTICQDTMPELMESDDVLNRGTFKN